MAFLSLPGVSIFKVTSFSRIIMFYQKIDKTTNIHAGKQQIVLKGDAKKIIQ